MQLTKKERANHVTPSNLPALKAASGRKLSDTSYYQLLMLIAEGCDLNGGDHNFYCTFGTTKKQDALTLSINLDGDRQTLYAASLEELALQAAEILGRA